jgi:AraC-like DNA-binding protein
LSFVPISTLTPTTQPIGVIVLLLALTCERIRSIDEHLPRMILAGELHNALRIGQERLERSAGPREAERHAAIGQLVGRALLATDRAEDAEDLFQRLLKVYESISRSSVRWLSSLDQGALSLHLGRPGRAAEAWNLVADDEAAPMPLRVEAMAGVAAALYHLGEHHRATATLREAQRLCEEANLVGLRESILHCELELATRTRLDTAEGLNDYALAISGVRVESESVAELCELLRACVECDAGGLLVSRTLEGQRLLLSGEFRASAGGVHLQSVLRWLRECGFVEREATLRLDAALAMLAADDAPGAVELLGVSLQSESALQRHRHATELKYCRSRLLATQGRHDNALRAYKEYARETLYRVMRERAHVPRSRFLERRLQAEEGDAAMFRLPLRYRRAYRFVIEHLGDSQLSIKQIAAHIDVTERALQMAFRKHLGMTPAELIRHHRMQGIRNDLRDGGGTGGVLKTAARWGMANRSTLAHGYRQLFSESPTATLRGQAA